MQTIYLQRSRALGGHQYGLQDDYVRALAKTDGFEQSRRERKKVEMRFADMKRILKLDRFRLRGLNGVRDEVLLTATAQNLRRLAKLIWRLPPTTASAGLT